jgi:hypothetical protein
MLQSIKEDNRALLGSSIIDGLFTLSTVFGSGSRSHKRRSVKLLVFTVLFLEKWLFDSCLPIHLPLFANDTTLPS